MTAMMSYWTFSDVFEEQGVIKTPFYGGYGLIAEGGVPKAAFNAFAMLHRLGDRRSQPDLANALVTKRTDGTLRSRGLELRVARYYSGRPRNTFRLYGGWVLRDIMSKFVDPDHGSALEAWKAMGSPANPTREQYERLKAAANVTQKLDGTSTFHAPVSRFGVRGTAAPLILCSIAPRQSFLVCS